MTGYLSGQVRIGYPSPRIGYAWTGYAVGGTPLAVSRRRTVLLTLLIFIANDYILFILKLTKSLCYQ